MDHRQSQFDLVVLGAGVVGITTAYWAMRAGLSVAVVELNSGPGRDASYANGGQISASYAEPWSNPRAPVKILKWLLENDSPLLFRPRLDWYQWKWIIGFFSQCRPRACKRNLAAIVELALYSREKLEEIRTLEGLQFSHSNKGIIRFYRDAGELEKAKAPAALLTRLGCRCEIISPAEVVEIEPAFAERRDLLAGAVYAESDGSGDAYRFTNELASVCETQGVKFYYRTAATGLVTTRARRVNTVTVAGPDASGEISGRHYVVSLGVRSASFLRPYGISLNIYPIKGYSASVPTDSTHKAPRVAVTDDQNKLVYSNLGHCLRVAGTGEASGFNYNVDTVRCRSMMSKIQQIFPRAGDFDQVRLSACLRPATPSNVPYLGPSRFSNLWLNTGHGTLGWTLSAGCGERIVRRIVQQV